MQGRTASDDGSRRAHEPLLRGRTVSYDGSRRAREPLLETHTDFLTDLFSCEPIKEACVKEQKMQGCTGSYNGSRRAHEAHEEKRTDFLTDVFSSFINLTRNEEAPIWEQGRTQDPNNRDRLFKSSWRQFGLLSCLDDETMQECVSCMKVRRCCDCVDAYFRVAKSNMTFKELHRCNHLPKVQPSLKMDLLAQPCTSWTWALRASQSSKMKLKLEAHDTKHALVLLTLQTRL
jgi:hypothetical protein